MVDRCAEFLQPILQTDLRLILFPIEGSEKDAEQLLVQTRFTQPALFVIEYALATLWMSWGIKPAAMIGHSVGEYVAACLAGVFSLEDGLTLIAERARLVQQQPGGAMLAVGLPENDVLQMLLSAGGGEMAIAAINSPGMCVVAGPHEEIAELEKGLSNREVTFRHLRTSHAFHSPMMDPVLPPFTEVVKKISLHEPQIPYVSNVSAQWITAADATDPNYWAGHVRQPVRFAEGISHFLQDPSNVLLEGRAWPDIEHADPAAPGVENRAVGAVLPGQRRGNGFHRSRMRQTLAGGRGRRCGNIFWRGTPQTSAVAGVSIRAHAPLGGTGEDELGRYSGHASGVIWSRGRSQASACLGAKCSRASHAHG